MVETAPKFPGECRRPHRTLALCSVLLSLGCSEATANSEPKAGTGSVAATRAEPRSVPEPKADFVLIHYPQIDIKSFVEVYAEKDARVLRVTRTVGEGIAARWKHRFRGSAAKRIDGIVGELTAGDEVAGTCPKRGGRDGVSWGVRNFARQIEYGIDFEMKDPGPECALIEAAAVALMRLAQLKCRATACIRPEEEASGRFTCATGEGGRECREALDGGYTIGPGRAQSSGE